MQPRLSSRLSRALLAAGLLGLTVVAWLCCWSLLATAPAHPRSQPATVVTITASAPHAAQPTDNGSDDPAYRLMRRTAGPRLLAAEAEPLQLWDVLPTRHGNDAAFAAPPRGPPGPLRLGTIRQQPGAYRLRAPPTGV